MLPEVCIQGQNKGKEGRREGGREGGVRAGTPYHSHILLIE